MLCRGYPGLIPQGSLQEGGRRFRVREGAVRMEAEIRKKHDPGTSPVVRWLRLHAPNTRFFLPLARELDLTGQHYEFESLAKTKDPSRHN